MGLLTDIVFRPRLQPDDFVRVRDLRCNRLAQMRDLPAAQAERAFVEHLFGEHPYGHLPIGTDASLRALAPDDVRAFHARRYRPAGTLLIAVGDVSHASIVAAAEEACAGGVPDGGVGFAPVPSAASGSEGRRLVIVDRPGAPQSELRVGHLAVARSTPDYHALVVLNAVLGGQFVSRINLNLREQKGFTYGARSGFDWRRAPGPFVVQTSVQTDATAAAVGEILREIEDIAGSRPPTPREMDLAKASLTRGYARNFETAEQVARALAQIAIYDLPDTWYDTFVDRVRAVDDESVTAAARRHLRPADALVTVVGDRTRIAGDLGALGFAQSHLTGAA
jgi:zinc protease